jgi:hypothetical protein
MPRRINWTDDELDEMIMRANEVEQLLRGVGHDCARDVLRARVRKVCTRQPHAQYL